MIFGEILPVPMMKLGTLQRAAGGYSWRPKPQATCYACPFPPPGGGLDKAPQDANEHMAFSRIFTGPSVWRYIIWFQRVHVNEITFNIENDNICDTDSCK